MATVSLSGYARKTGHYRASSGELDFSWLPTLEGSGLGLRGLGLRGLGFRGLGFRGVWLKVLDCRVYSRGAAS